MRRMESTVDIQNRLVFVLGVKSTKGVDMISAALRDAQRNGIRLAAEVAAAYDKYSSHDHLVSECILGKLNVLKRRPRKNPNAGKIDMVITQLERRVASVEGTMRFLGISAKTRKRKV
jgi:hypothetical protein